MSWPRIADPTFKSLQPPDVVQRGCRGPCGSVCVWCFWAVSHCLRPTLRVEMMEQVGRAPPPALAWYGSWEERTFLANNYKKYTNIYSVVNPRHTSNQHTFLQSATRFQTAIHKLWLSDRSCRTHSVERPGSGCWLLAAWLSCKGSMGLVGGHPMTTFIYQQRKLCGIIQLLLHVIY